MLNRFEFIGKVIAKPELKETAKGYVTNLKIVTRYKSKDEFKSEYHHILLFDNVAKLCCSHIDKNKNVYIKGRIQTKIKEDQNGDRIHVVQLVARRIIFLDPKPINKNNTNIDIKDNEDNDE